MILVSNLKTALQKAINKCYKPIDDEFVLLTDALDTLLNGVDSTIELTKVYSIQILLLICIGYVPISEEFECAYQYLVLKNAYQSTICGGGMSLYELERIINDLEQILPAQSFNSIYSRRSELKSAYTLYTFTKYILEVK
ncbi:MAG: hypothetical protein ACRCST_10695 [Turicibacter sp.]